MRNSKNMKKNHVGWDWSLKPLSICMQLVGINLIGPSSYSAKNVAMVNFLILTLLGVAIFLLNLVTNGPRLLYLFRFDFIESTKGCEISPWACTSLSPELLIKLVYHVARILLVSFMPIIHIVFALSTFSPNWRNLWATLNEIQLKINLNAEFHKTCRKKCLLAMLFLLLVLMFNKIGAH